VKPIHALTVVLLPLGGLCCSSYRACEPPAARTELSMATTDSGPPRSEGHQASDATGPVRTVDVPVPGDRPAVVVRGAREHRKTMLFIPGMCVHPGGYVMSFQYAAAARGELIAVQGDVSCGGDGAMRRWSYDLEAMNRRIDAAFAAAGLGEPHDVIMIGYSQGAERAEKLVGRWPAKYSRAVLIASPVAPSPQLLGRAKAVALMAGTNDIAQGTMRAAVAPLQRGGVSAAYFPIPNARHGQMGDTPEETMRRALDFVESAGD
jgi:pimeloyl-ACP methyl ester carboxylesterase